MFGIQLASALVRKPGRRRPVRYVPVLHGLEERCLLSTFHEYSFPDNGHGVHLTGITAGPDGNVWFTNSGTDLGRGEVDFITPDGAITAFPQGPGNRPSAIVTGADGNLWYGGFFFDTFDGAEIGQITPDGTATTFRLPNFGGFFEIVQAVTLGPDGNVWFGQANYTPTEGVIGHITPDGQAASSFVPHDGLGAPASGGIDSITTGPDGNIWFIPEFLDGHYYAGRVTPDGQYTFFETPGTDNLLASITAGPDGNLWAVALQFDHRTGQLLSASIDRITVNGQFTEFPLPDVSHDASHITLSITLGPDGNLWFTEPFANQIGMMTPDGQLTEYAIPTPNSNPQLITAGPDGNIWFTEVGSGQIGEFVLNDPGSGARATSATSAQLAPAVESLVASAQPDPQKPVFGNEQHAVVAVDATFTASPPETVASPKARQEEVTTMPYQHPEDRAETAAAGLADPLAAVVGAL